MTPSMKQFQSKGRGWRGTNPCREISILGPITCKLGTYGQVNKKLSLARRVWKNADGAKIPLGKMNRGHLQAAMQWCMKRRTFGRTKDGYTYDEWIAMFVAKLLDPNTLE